MTTPALYFPQQHHSSHGGHHNQHSHSHSHHNHHARSRRAPRISSSHHNKPAQIRAARTHKELVEAAAVSAYRQGFEAARSFDLDDDELFCPFNLLTIDDLQSLHSGSDRSSLSSGSPEQSPLQHQLQPTPAFMLPASNFSQSTLAPHGSTSNSATTLIHQPLAQRSKKIIPIVDPSTRNASSPPPSVSPGRRMMTRGY